jgi:adenylate cyclase
MRVSRTFAFLDLCGFTRFTETHGDQAAVEVLARLRAVLRAVSEQRGVRVAHWMGDGAMLTAPDAHAVAACAVEARDRMATGSPLPLRGGIAGGPVIMFEGDDYVGSPVNVAARLCRAAEPNRVLTTSDTFGAPGSGVLLTRPHRHLTMDGLTHAVAVVEVVHIHPAVGISDVAIAS